MANGRVRSVIDRGYDTTLADFLDKLPQFFLQQQQLKDARDERNKDRQFQQTQYENQLEQQRKNNEYRQSEADYRKTQDNLKLVLDTVNKAPFGQRYSTFKKLVTNNSDYTSADVGNLESMYKKNDELFKNYQQIDDKYDEINEMPPLSQFEEYNSMVGIRDNLKNLQGSVSDVNLKTTVDNQIKNITNQIKFLESNAGKKYNDDQIPDNKMNALRNLRGRQQSTYNDLDTIKNNLLKYSKYVPPTRDDKGNLVTKETYEMLPFPGKQRTQNIESAIDMGDVLSGLEPKDEIEWQNKYNTLMRQYANKKNQYNTDTFRLNDFYKNNNLIYPQLNIDKDKTTGDPKGTETDDGTAYAGAFSEGYPARPEDDIDVITDKQAEAGLKNPELGMQILGYLENPTSENFQFFKDGVLQEGEYANLIKQFNELGDEEKPSITMVSQEDSGIPKNWKIGAGTNQIAVDDRERETIVDDASDPAQDFVENEDKISPILSPVTAGTRSETADRDPSQYKKDINLATIFPKPLVSKENYNLSDIAKGGKETGAVRRYANKGLGENLKSYVTLSNVLSQYREGDVFNKKQTSSRIKSLEEKIKSEVGDYINPETGEFKDTTYTNRIYDRLQKRYFPDLSLREIKDLLRGFSTAKTMSKKSKVKFTAN